MSQLPVPAQRLNNLPTYAFAILNQKIRELTAQGVDIIRLDIGSPDMPPPAAVVNQLVETVHDPDAHGYAGYKGTPEFRAAVAHYYQKRFGVTVHPETEVLPLLGSKEGIVNLSLAYLDRGDVTLVPEISYPSYSMGASIAGGEVCWLPMSVETGYLPDVSAVPSEPLSRAKLLWVNYPNNPTGATADLDFYAQMVDFCRAHKLMLASDNPYVDVTFDGYVAPSALQVEGAKDCTVEFVSFSKTYNMAGWRLGAAVGNAKALQTLLNVKSNLDSGHFQAIYDAGVTAVDTDDAWLAERNAIYEGRRDRILAVLPDIGLEALVPKGSLYIWARVLQGDGGQYTEQALAATGVALTPGAVYGPRGTGYIRISLGMHDDRIDEALQRLKMWYASS